MTEATVVPIQPGERLNVWAQTHQPRETLHWHSGYKTLVDLINRRIAPVFFRSAVEQDRSVTVIGTHTSKSVLLPVINIVVPNLVSMVLSYNFHCWSISVNAHMPVPDNFFDLFDRTVRKNSVYYYGFKDEWVFSPYAANPQTFSLHLYDDYELYMFCRLLAAGLGLQNDSYKW